MMVDIRGVAHAAIAFVGWWLFVIVLAGRNERIGEQTQGYCSDCLHCQQVVGYHCECTIHGRVGDEVKYCADKELKEHAGT